MQSKAHWENIYQTKDATQVSWFQERPAVSLDIIEKTRVDKAGQIIEIGGGASLLVDYLLANDYQNITVLDISMAALQVAQKRLESRAALVTWLQADITKIELPENFYDVWHDRAVFHFLTQPEDRNRYVETVRRSVKARGHIIVATFATDGPHQCSGLEVMKYDPDSLHNEFGDDFELVGSAQETHHTPFETAQKFIYCYCRKA
jgi:ubiquinone/menaquinone biosynthesis C-methylase UbiE